MQRQSVPALVGGLLSRSAQGGTVVGGGCGGFACRRSKSSWASLILVMLWKARVLGILRQRMPAGHGDRDAGRGVRSSGEKERERVKASLAAALAAAAVPASCDWSRSPGTEIETLAGGISRQRRRSGREGERSREGGREGEGREGGRAGEGEGEGERGRGRERENQGRTQQHLKRASRHDNRGRLCVSAI